jgi:hypothetical protein
METAVFSAVVEKGFAFLELEALDFGNKNGVVSGNIGSNDIAGEMGKCVFKQRDACRGPLEANTEAGFLGRILFRFCKVFGDLLLRILQDVHAEAALGVEIGQKEGVVIDTDKDEKRIERNRSEGICSHPMDLARFSFDSEHRNAGGETAHHAAE